MIKKFLFLVPLFGMVVACRPPLTREQQLAIYKSRCLDYGYQMGTPEFSECMMRQEERAEERAYQAQKIGVMEEHNWIQRQKLWAKQKEVEQRRKKRKR